MFIFRRLITFREMLFLVFGEKVAFFLCVLLLLSSFFPPTKEKPFLSPEKVPPPQEKKTKQTSEERKKERKKEMALEGASVLVKSIVTDTYYLAETLYKAYQAVVPSEGGAVEEETRKKFLERLKRFKENTFVFFFFFLICCFVCFLFCFVFCFVLLFSLTFFPFPLFLVSFLFFFFVSCFFLLSSFFSFFFFLSSFFFLGYLFSLSLFSLCLQQQINTTITRLCCNGFSFFLFFLPFLSSFSFFLFFPPFLSSSSLSSPSLLKLTLFFFFNKTEWRR